MLPDDVIIIKKWYLGTLKSSILPQNTIKAVDIVKNKVEIQGFQNAKSIFINGTTDDDFVYNGGYNSVADKSYVVGTNSNPMDSNFESIEAVQEVLGTLTITFDNTNHDTNADNYSFTDAKYTMKWDGPIGVAFTYLYGFSGSLINTNGKRWDENFITPVITFSGNSIIATFSNVLLYGNYNFKWSNSGSLQARNYVPYFHNFTFNYGGFSLSQEKVSYGGSDSKNSFEISNNGFFENSSTNNSSDFCQTFANKIIEKWGNGRQYIEIVVPENEYKNESGGVVISKSGNKKIFNQFDRVAVFNGSNSLYDNPLGTPKIFTVVSSNFSYDGETKFNLKLMEEV